MKNEVTCNQNRVSGCVWTLFYLWFSNEGWLSCLFLYCILIRYYVLWYWSDCHCQATMTVSDNTIDSLIHTKVLKNYIYALTVDPIVECVVQIRRARRLETSDILYALKQRVVQSHLLKPISRSPHERRCDGATWRAASLPSSSAHILAINYLGMCQKYVFDDKYKGNINEVSSVGVFACQAYHLFLLVCVVLFSVYLNRFVLVRVWRSSLATLVGLH